MVLTGYDASNNVVASNTFSFTVNPGGNAKNKTSRQFGNLNSSGDAGTAAANEPGRAPLAIVAPAGTTISKATLNFVDRAGMDSNIAIGGLRYTLAGFGPPTDKDQCKNGGWQLFDFPRKFKNQGDCVSFTNTGR